jgi:hypothetical protein
VVVVVDKKGPRPPRVRDEDSNPVGTVRAKLTARTQCHNYDFPHPLPGLTQLATDNEVNKDDNQIYRKQFSLFGDRLLQYRIYSEDGEQRFMSLSRMHRLTTLAPPPLICGSINPSISQFLAWHGSASNDMSHLHIIRGAMPGIAMFCPRSVGAVSLTLRTSRKST